MFQTFLLPDGAPAVIVVRGDTRQRLSSTCFRMGARPRAGNFRHWRSVTEVFANSELRQQFLTELLNAICVEEALRSVFTGLQTRVTVQCSRPVGWASTAPIDSVPQNALEVFEPNRKSTARRVKRNRTDLLAPATQLVTFVVEIKFERELGWVTVVHTMYPGADVGPLVGDVTDRSGQIFMDWRHPGVPL